MTDSTFAKSGDGRRVALVTYLGSPELTTDDGLLLQPLAELGVTAEAVPWDDSGADWRGYDAIVIRSCWDYHRRPDEFARWLEHLETIGARVLNPIPLLRWNSDKRYLLELARGGVSTIPTRVLQPGDDVELGRILESERWDEAVVKPVVSASADGTWRTGISRVHQDQAAFGAQLTGGAVMVQPYVESIERDGELSLLFYGGQYSHAVRKLPARGDFRVQIDRGGTAARTEPPEEVIADAEHALSLVPGRTAYARVDGCVIDGKFTLMEMEVLEPGLFLRFDLRAAEKLARAIAEVACA